MIRISTIYDDDDAIRQTTAIAAIPDCDLVIIQAQDSDIRGKAIRAAMDARKPIAIYGISHETAQQLNHLATQTKKRHIPVCWLNSLRFVQSVAKLKEIIESGICGNLLSLNITGHCPNALQYAIDDLSLHIFASLTENQITNTTTVDDITDLHFLLKTENLTLELIIEAKTSQLSIKYANGRTINHAYPVTWHEDYDYLISTFKYGNSWNILPQIPRTKTKLERNQQ